ncbi:MAG: sugar phosphate nucleotidyltransferase [Patescibacteria group bacterium]
MGRKVRKAVIPAAGFGTRFLPATKTLPKEMLPIVDKPVIQYVVESLVEAGITDIIIVTGYTKRAIEDHFDVTNHTLVENLKAGGQEKSDLLAQVEAISQLANFSYVRQKGPYGNATPLLNVQSLIGNEPFIYTWADDLIQAERSEFRQLLDVAEKYPDTPILAGIAAKNDEDYQRYGFAGGEELAPGLIQVANVIEKPGKAQAPSNMALVSGMVLTPDIYQYFDQAYELSSNREVNYIDALKLMIQDGKQVLAAEIQGGTYFDTGNKLEYLKTVVEFALAREDLGAPFRAFLEQTLNK